MCTIYGDGGGEREETHGKSHSVCRLHSLSNSGEYSKKKIADFLSSCCCCDVFFLLLLLLPFFMYMLCVVFRWMNVAHMG